MWSGYIKPFKIFGNLYFVGTTPASTHLIDTGDGLILIDSGYKYSLHVVVNNIWDLGFSPFDIKYILHTHGHIDHFGGTKALVELTDAKTFIGRPDEDYCNGKLDLSWAKELGMELEPFSPDVLIDDGDIIRLGNTEILCVATPGHTPGAMTFFFDVTDGKETFRAALHAGTGLNSLTADFLKKYDLPFSLRDDFVASMKKLSEMNVDIHLGNHAHQNDTVGKAERVRAGDVKAFVDPDEWKAFNLECIERLYEMIEQENK